MKMLGFKPTPNSGSGWITKEDGENEYGICQLKSTDKNSIRIDLKDIETLEYHSIVSHKVPVFAIQFLSSDEVFLIIRPEFLEDLVRVVKYGGQGNPQGKESNPTELTPEVLSGIPDSGLKDSRSLKDYENPESRNQKVLEGSKSENSKIEIDLKPKGGCNNQKPVIRSSISGRKKFMKENDMKYKKKSKSAK